jgi:hypothetical protein
MHQSKIRYISMTMKNYDLGLLITLFGSVESISNDKMNIAYFERVLYIMKEYLSVIFSIPIKISSRCRNVQKKFQQFSILISC